MSSAAHSTSLRPMPALIPACEGQYRQWLRLYADNYQRVLGDAEACITRYDRFEEAAMLYARADAHIGPSGQRRKKLLVLVAAGVEVRVDGAMTGVTLYLADGKLAGDPDVPCFGDNLNHWFREGGVPHTVRLGGTPGPWTRPTPIEPRRLRPRRWWARWLLE